MLIQGAPQEKGGRFPVWKAVMAHEQEEKGILGRLGDSRRHLNVVEVFDRDKGF